jgi:predicted RNase H-like nuclease (RuvC/YqgF family)
MLTLLTFKEFAKIKGLTEIAVRKQVEKDYVKSITILSKKYILYEDNRIEKLQNLIKQKNAKIRELRLKLTFAETKAEQKENKNELEKELEKDKKRLLKKIEKLEKKLENERIKKDELYEKILGTLSSRMMLQSNEKAGGNGRN